MAKVIIPKTYIKNINKPVIFLAGPVRSAPNWQDVAIQYLFSQNPNLIIVSPRRGIRKKIAPYIFKGNNTYFSRQREWERHYLDIASKKGCILFWLPEEQKHDCKKVYGAMTRIEIGQWITNYRYNPSVRFCIGSDNKFPEMHTITYDLTIDAPDKKIFPFLKKTCLEALKIASQ